MVAEWFLQALENPDIIYPVATGLCSLAAASGVMNMLGFKAGIDTLVYDSEINSQETFEQAIEQKSKKVLPLVARVLFGETGYRAGVKSMGWITYEELEERREGLRERGEYPIRDEEE